MRHAPLLAAAVCLLVTGCAGSLGATAATHGPTSAKAARGASPAPSATPAPTPPPAAATAIATASPTPAASTYLFDVASRPQCGVPDGTVPATGQEIVISLSCQELSAYQDGVPVLSTPVTTGKPALPTPTGHYSVLRRSSPYRMVSSWPYGTIGWYAPSWVTWVLWFRGDGYGIHDASWRSAYGPGTEANGSHGCVNVPHDAMRHLYAWAANGAAVDIL
jgi:lipoprotein-anchoring transpeptidase ErfK/SrfK